jgi:NAD-dependent deacetylase
MEVPARLAEALRSARRVAVFTGAGVSAESGIPTFRDALTGLWQRFDAAQLATAEAFQRDPDLVWGWYEWRRMRVMKAQPNAAHLAIAALEQRVPLDLITQNVDDLHERAGSRAPIRLHGSLFAPRCFDCDRQAELPPAVPEEPEGGRRSAPPRCGHCGGRLRPGVVWFGEALPAQALVRAIEAARSCDVLLSVGTSALVHPAAGIPVEAKDAGATVVQINPNATALDAVADFNLRGPAAEVLPKMVSGTNLCRS